MNWNESILYCLHDPIRGNLGYYGGTMAHIMLQPSGPAARSNISELCSSLEYLLTYFARVCWTQHCSGKKSPQFKWFSWFYPCCKPSHLKSFKFHPLGSSFFRNYVVWFPAADSEKISFKSSIRAVGRTHPALNAQPMLKYLENPKKLLKIGLQGNGLKI